MTFHFDFIPEKSYIYTMETDVAIIGAGPIGIEMAAILKKSEIDYLHFEAGQIGNTFLKWPPGTYFYSTPEWVAIAGIPIHTHEQFRLTGEMYLSYLRTVIETYELDVRTYEKVISINGQKGDFTLTTQNRAGNIQVNCNSIILATGGLDTPRKLAIPGEDKPHVHYRLRNPHVYFNQPILVIGGRNSALEAVVRCWRAGAETSWSYRQLYPDKKKVNSRMFLEADLLIKKSKIDFYPDSRPIEIRDTTVKLEKRDNSKKTTSIVSVPAHFVIAATGYNQDKTLFNEIGIKLSGKEKIPAFNPKTMETSIPGIFMAGTAAAGTQIKFREFITTGHEHCKKILSHLFGKRTRIAGNYSPRDYDLLSNDVE